MRIMQEPFFIKKIAVLGAGVMGAQIAAHCVNAGITTLLFDLASKENSPNELINKAITALGKLKPAPFATARAASYLRACNYEEHLESLKDCDLVIEAIAERFDWKEALYQRISPYLHERAILVSNTSGLSINALAQVLPELQQRRFCGVHFFNPPRYMHLAELIAAEKTEPLLLDHLEAWLTSYLGKGVVRAKDTPNFIANRIGVFSLLVTMHHAEALQLTFDEVDALTGPLLGRPKSATFRTMDVVGLDTLQHVVHTMQEQLKNDPWHALFALPSWLIELIQTGSLGQKTGEGIYRKNGKTIEVYNPHSKSYQPSSALLSEAVKEILKSPSPVQRMELLAASDDKQAKFLTACYRDLFHYCAYHLEEIAYTVRDVDLAMRWGFGWLQGPFETWQMTGFESIKHLINSSSLMKAPLPQWIENIDEFYKNGNAYSPQEKDYTPARDLPIYQRQFFADKVLKETNFYTPTLFENEAVHLWYLQDDIAVINFKSKANSIGQGIIDGLEHAINKAEKECQGLIIYQSDASNFSVGADLRSVLSLIQANKMTALERMVVQFQYLAQRLKYSPIPTIAALRGRALGGGCELMMQCHGVMAAFESYPGLVEVAVGLIPAGGGCKELALRAAEKSISTNDLMLFIQPYFQQLATARVATSAPEALELGYLRPTDSWVMHPNEVLFAAVAKIKALSAANYQAPLRSTFKVAGLEGHARLKAGLVNWLEGGFISQHDYFITDHLAAVICGGNVNQGESVTEKWLLQLEKEAFMTLAAHPLTQARMAHLLETGKPLRN